MYDVDFSVSVIIPVYNSKRFIRSCVESVLAQTYSSFEVVLVDDCSTDGTQEILKELSLKDRRIKVILLKSNNGGPAIPRNIGVENARYCWIAFLDSDDVWVPSKLEKQLHIIKKYKANMVCSRNTHFRNDQAIKCTVIPNPKVIRVTFFSLALRSKIPTSSVIIRKDLMLEQRFNSDYPTTQDYDCWLRILRKGYICYKIEDHYVNYRLHSNQISRSKIYMLKRVFIVHKNLFKGFFIPSILCCTHVLGGLYSRLIKGGL